jgi:hypothetical protein
MTPYEKSVYRAELQRRKNSVAAYQSQHKRRGSGAAEREVLHRSTPMEIETRSRKGEVLFDSGANCCISFDKSDFTAIHPPGSDQVDGIGKGLKIEGRGQVKWTLKCDNGQYRSLYLPAYYVPSVTTRIASTQVILEQYPNETIVMDNEKLVMSGTDKLPSITVPYQSESKLPTARVYKQGDNAMNWMLSISCRPGEMIGHLRHRGDDDDESP